MLKTNKLIHGTNQTSTCIVLFGLGVVMFPHFLAAPKLETPRPCVWAWPRTAARYAKHWRRTCRDWTPPAASNF